MRRLLSIAVGLADMKSMFSTSMGKLFSIGLIIVSAISLRLYNIDGNSLWLDEAYSAWFAKKSLNYIWTVGPSFEVTPPLYLTLLHIWILLGDSETALRLLSVLISVLTVPLVYGLGRTIGGADRGHLIHAQAFEAGLDVATHVVELTDRDSQPALVVPGGEGGVLDRGHVE